MLPCMAFDRRQIILGAVCLGLGGLGVAALAAPNGGVALVAMLCLSTLLLLAPFLVVFGLVLSILALGPLLLLARPLGLRIVGCLLTACLALLACFMVAAACATGSATCRCSLSRCCLRPPPAPSFGHTVFGCGGRQRGRFNYFGPRR